MSDWLHIIPKNEKTDTPKNSEWFNGNSKSFENWKINFKESSPFSPLTHSTWKTFEVRINSGITKCSLKGKLSFNLFMVQVLSCLPLGSHWIGTMWNSFWSHKCHWDKACSGLLELLIRQLMKWPVMCYESLLLRPREQEVIEPYWPLELSLGLL